MRGIPLISILGLLAGGVAWAHGGGLDNLGCHNDRRNGGYHCHRGPLAGWSFSSKAEARRELQKKTPPPKPAPGK